MTDATLCDRCGAIEKFASRVTEYELPNRVCDIEANQDAIDVKRSGHLCEACSRALAEWLTEDPHDDAPARGSE